MDDKIICPYCEAEVFIDSGDVTSLAYGYELTRVCIHCEKVFKLSATVMFKTEEIDNG